MSTSVTESSTIADGCAVLSVYLSWLYSFFQCLVKNDATLKYIYDSRDRICKQLQDREASFTHSIWYVVQIISVWCYMLALMSLALYVYSITVRKMFHDAVVPTIKTVNILQNSILILYTTTNYMPK